MIYRSIGFLGLMLLATFGIAGDRIQIKGALESVQYDGRRTNIDLAVGDVLKVELSSPVHDPIKWIEIQHSKQRLQVGRVLTESYANDEGIRPVGAINMALFFSVTQHGNETLFVRAHRESGPDQSWRQIDLRIQPPLGAGAASTTTARPAR